MSTRGTWKHEYKLICVWLSLVIIFSVIFSALQPEIFYVTELRGYLKYNSLLIIQKVIKKFLSEVVYIFEETNQEQLFWDNDRLSLIISLWTSQWWKLRSIAPSWKFLGNVFLQGYLFIMMKIILGIHRSIYDIN